MKKKLPKVFANKIDKEIKNNEKVYMSNKEEINETKVKKEKRKPEKTINQKITKIINNKNYIYKIPVIIYMEDKEIKTYIIGQNKKNIITYDNKLIDIEKIKDIKIDE